ncbi:archaetidylserine decarboxylase [Endozoicomonas sp.]|uniref:archaetidylserine decarboxylase n=1 Tax=Endozoicomonas sp. TaxID=1892382 RepID=UPI002885396C|nr:archaetidylserine decarboxylase [Endozoicomonas sp.]
MASPINIFSGSGAGMPGTAPCRDKQLPVTKTVSRQGYPLRVATHKLATLRGRCIKPLKKLRIKRRAYSIRKVMAKRTEKLTIKLQMKLPHKACSKLFGKIADCTNRPIKNWLIRKFVWMHKINLQEAVKKKAADYKCFNEFFTRKLEKGARTIASEGKVASPVDGTISAIGEIKDGQLIQAKGRSYTVQELLGGDEQLARAFMGGSYANIYLSPGDYHRFHMPAVGTLKKTIHIPGKLFSVSPKASRNIDRLFARNERLVCIFETAQGPMAMIMVGAINVSSIETDWAGGVIKPRKKDGPCVTNFDTENKEYKTGDDLGAFRIGSTVICLFGQDKVGWLESLGSGQKVRMGQEIGSLLTP